MTIDELKASVERHRADLRAKGQHPVYMSEAGPVGMSLIDVLVAMIESQQLRIEKLEERNR
jgi:hypothetical protein